MTDTTGIADVDRLAIDTIRTLAMDAVQQANSGHPGTPMALAPVTYVLWNEFLKYDPTRPQWPVRDRFVLSCGHASMLLYAMLHLAGVRKTKRQPNGTIVATDEWAIGGEDLRNFRQFGSPCAGHPEYGYAAGIETTTGPLGQGIGNSVGMAIAAQWFAARYGRPGFEDLFASRVYALCSDGDIMEGVGCEAASLAGHLKLGNLCWIYDDNRITIEGKTELAFSEDVARRFQGQGWHVLSVEDANDLTAIRQALTQASGQQSQPTLIVLRSVIAWGSPGKANTHGAHGSPLGEDEVRRTKQVYGWPEDEHFRVPEDARRHVAETLGARGKSARQAWDVRYSQYQQKFPDAAAEFQSAIHHQLPADWETAIPTFTTKDHLATRVSSGKVLNAIGKRLPWLVGGAADLAPSTKTLLEFEGAGQFSAAQRGGRNLHFGIREHAMASAANGMSLSGLRPYVATFFVFSDYLRPALRLSALMHQPVLYILTHDSIGLGEDGPTHQPVEQLAACRAIPGLVVLRPADANEVAESYRVAIQGSDRPVALVLTRQDVPTFCRQRFAPATGLARGAYVMAEAGNDVPQVILIGTGSELHLCAEAYDRLVAAGIRARLVSMPSWELFEQQDVAYRESVLPSRVTARIAVEAGIRQGWDRYLGPRGRFLGMEGFGLSAPYEELYAHFGLTVDQIHATALDLVADS